MYQIERGTTVVQSQRKLTALFRRWPWVHRNVLFLGLTSLFTDISSEMVSTILPLYLVFTLHLAPLQFGILDGLYQGASIFVRVAGGFVADRWQRYKEVATLGYGLSAVCKLGFLLVGGIWTALATVILVDRTGKGIRTAPRDALISLSSPADTLATAFGVHRMLDTAGAMLGPLVAFGLLLLVPESFDTIFVVSFCIALIGLGVLVLFVENRPTSSEVSTESSAVSLRAAAGLLRLPRFRPLALVGAMLGLFTISDGFLYLGIQRRLDFNVGYLPLLYVFTALIYMLLAVPVGRLADRIGRGRVFIAGYGLLLCVYLSLLLPVLGIGELFAYMLLIGVYYAATEGVMMALVSASLPKLLRTSGIAIFTTMTGLARLLASILFGLLWTVWTIDGAVVTFAGALIVALAGAVVVFTRLGRAKISAATCALKSSRRCRGCGH